MPLRLRHILSREANRRRVLCVQQHFRYRDFGSYGVLRGGYVSSALMLTLEGSKHVVLILNQSIKTFVALTTCKPF
jgi:hypothetical protein